MAAERKAVYFRHLQGFITISIDFTVLIVITTQ